MKRGDVTLALYDESKLQLVANMNRFELEDLEDAIYVRKLELMVAALNHAGFYAVSTGGGHQFRYILVGLDATTEHLPREWATLEECRRLLDTVANLPPVEAFKRWRTRIEPLEIPVYTEEQAKRDIRAERAELKRQYDNGEISASELRDGWAAARDRLK